MTESLKVKVTLKGHDFSEREQQLIHVLNTNIAAFQSNSLTQRNLVLNNLDKDTYDLTHQELIFEEAINDEVLSSLTERLQRTIPSSFKRAGIDTEMLEVLVY